MCESNDKLRNTALFSIHKDHGAKFCSFGGWNMPLQYQSIISEHRLVREIAGLFDLCHMGELRITGERATEFLYRSVSIDPTTMEIGDLRYALLLNDAAGIVDDIVISRLEEGYLIITNASNKAIDHQWLMTNCPLGADVTDMSDELGMIAIQGPKSVAILGTLMEHSEFSKLPFYRSSSCVIADIPIILCRSGYTGEDGFELICNNNYIKELWSALCSAGASTGLRPAGLGARDTLRLEMGYSLYGHELTQATNPIEAGLKRFVDMSKAEFIGKRALEKILMNKPIRKLVGLKVIDRGIIREGYSICNTDGGKVGYITSGSISPTLGVSIGMAYVDTAYSRLGESLVVDVRGKSVDVCIVKRPFVTPRTYREGM